MFWMLLSYTVAKLHCCNSVCQPRNSASFTRLFLLMRGWGLGTRLVFSLEEHFAGQRVLTIESSLAKVVVLKKID